METVLVWTAPLLVPDALHASLDAALSTAERERADRFRSAADARRFSVARGWLRMVLGAELATPPAAVPISGGPGKPRLLDGRTPFFNLSHAGELVVVAVAGREVGVDIEHTASGAGGMDAARLACTPSELAMLDRLPQRERADAFLRLWTAKEAYLKARGVGLAVAPDKVEIAAARAGSAPVRLEAGAVDSRWRVRELRPAPDYVGAVAAEGADWAVECRSAADLLDGPAAPSVGVLDGSMIAGRGGRA